MRRAVAVGTLAGEGGGEEEEGGRQPRRGATDEPAYTHELAAGWMASQTAAWEVEDYNLLDGLTVSFS